VTWGGEEVVDMVVVGVLDKVVELMMEVGC